MSDSATVSPAATMTFASPLVSTPLLIPCEAVSATEVANQITVEFDAAKVELLTTEKRSLAVHVASIWTKVTFKPNAGLQTLVVRIRGFAQVSPNTRATLLAQVAGTILTQEFGFGQDMSSNFLLENPIPLTLPAGVPADTPLTLPVPLTFTLIVQRLTGQDQTQLTIDTVDLAAQITLAPDKPSAPSTPTPPAAS